MAVTHYIAICVMLAVQQLFHTLDVYKRQNFFSLHLKNVLFRWNNNTFNTNPFSDQIFIQNPLIYDIAVYIANEIRNRYHCKLNKDEITFISLHIGAVIEKKAEESHTYKALLIMNEYYYPVSNYLYQFQKEFQNKIDIVSIMQSIHSVSYTHLSSVPVHPSDHI